MLMDCKTKGPSNPASHLQELPAVEACKNSLRARVTESHPSLARPSEVLPSTRKKIPALDHDRRLPSAILRKEIWNPLYLVSTVAMSCKI